MSTTDVRDYYRTITEQDIATVARELLGSRIMEEKGALMECDCPQHQSISRRSLHINVDRQAWYCFGCGVGGDILQLVEFVQSGQVTAGRSGVMSDTHRTARDWLAARVSLPPLSHYGLTPAEIARHEATRAQEMRVQEALSAMVDIYHARLKEHPEMVAVLKEKYALTDETIDDLRIGYADNDEHERGITKPLREGPEAFTNAELAATGAFIPTADGRTVPLFNKRLVFPYWSRGRVVFAIARKTFSTPNTQYEQAKYKKLMVHSVKAPHVSTSIKNDVLYNEDCLTRSPDSVIITEGITDCIALMQHGFTAISPVTVRVRKDDWHRIGAKLRNVGTVTICQDNEVSESGLKGALASAYILARKGIAVRIAVLPLGEKQLRARRELAERFGIRSVDGEEAAANEVEKGNPEIERLLGDAKIDVAEYFASGHSCEDFEEILCTAQAPVEFGINSLSIPVDGSLSEDTSRRLETLIHEIAGHSPLEQARFLKRIQERLGKAAVPMRVLEAQVRKAEKTAREAAKQEGRQQKRRSTAKQGSCRACIDEVMFDCAAAGQSVDYAKVAAAAYDWFEDHGGRFFHSPQGEPFMYFDNAIYWMDTSDKGRKRAWHAMIFKQTGLVATSMGCRTFLEVLSNLALDRGQACGHLSWLHTKMDKHSVYFNLNNEDYQIVKMSPDGVEVMQNGGNADNVILDCSRKIKPITFIPDADYNESARLLSELLIENMTCEPQDRYLIISWLSCFLLIDYAGTRPMTRFEGVSGSGKSAASKMISMLMYGTEEQKNGTDAANYADGAQNPLIILDNIETRQMTDELTRFMLTSVTGIAREKRRSGTDSDTVVERTKCLLNTNGIEPLSADLSEIQSRTFTIQFNIENQLNVCFLEKPLLAKISAHRDLILSAIMKTTARALTLIRDGVLERIMALLHKQFGNHGKRRCNDYIALMYLMLVAPMSTEEREMNLSAVNATFFDQFKSINAVSEQVSRDSNPIAIALSSLFGAHKTALAMDRKEKSQYDSNKHLLAFTERYQVVFKNETEMDPMSAGTLLRAIKRISHDFSVTFPYDKPEQLARRIKNDLSTIKKAGFAIERERNKRTHNFEYSITAVEILETASETA